MRSEHYEELAVGLLAACDARIEDLQLAEVELQKIDDQIASLMSIRERVADRIMEGRFTARFGSAMKDKQ